MRIFIPLVCAILLAAPAIANTLPFTGTFSYSVGEGTRCDFDVYDKIDLGCYGVGGGWDTNIHFDSTQNADLSGDILHIFVGGGGFLPLSLYYDTNKQGAYFSEYHEFGPGGGHVRHTFDGDSGTFVFYDDDIPNFGTITRAISNVSVSLAFQANSAQIAAAPLPTSLSLGFGGLGMLAFASWTRRRHQKSVAR